MLRKGVRVAGTRSAMIGLGLLAAVPAVAQDRTYDVRLMTPETAMEIAMGAMQACRDRGFQVAVAVVDRFGVPQALVRDRIAGPHTPDTAIRKAWTAVSFRASTTDLSASTGPDSAASGARDITNALMLGGGITVQAQGGLIGGIGVSGAPSGEEDEACAEAGLSPVAMELEF